MNEIFSHFLYPISPLLPILLAALIIILIDCFKKVFPKGLSRWIALLGVVGSGACVLTLGMKWPLAFSQLRPSGDTIWLIEFAKHFRLDALALYMWGALSVFGFVALLYSRYFPIEDESLENETQALILFTLFGMGLLVTADSLLMIFLALELMSLPTYVLVGMRRNNKDCTEAALKYFLFGSFATVLLVFGIALIYAQFGSLHIPTISAMVETSVFSDPVSQLLSLGGFMLLLVAVCFKVGIAPFHMWLPDVYQGAPASLTAFMGSAIKLAGFGIAIKVLWTMFVTVSDSWIPFVGGLAVLTMFVGNLAALAQKNLKRMFAYSSIAHAGYLLLALCAIPHGAPGKAAIFFYLFVYGLMFLALFGVIALIETQRKSTDLKELSGLGFAQPLLGIAMSLCVLSAAGIPPTVGFFAKYFIFMGLASQGHLLLLVLALVSTAIGIAYYLKVMVYLYMKENPNPAKLAVPIPIHVCILVCSFAMLLLAAFPSLLGLGHF